jgi:hypothetical protein
VEFINTGGEEMQKLLTDEGYTDNRLVTDAQPSVDGERTGLTYGS